METQKTLKNTEFEIFPVGEHLKISYMNIYLDLYYGKKFENGKKVKSWIVMHNLNTNQFGLNIEIFETYEEAIHVYNKYLDEINIKI